MPFGLTKETKSNHIFYYLNNDYYCQIIYCILYVDLLFYFDCLFKPKPPPPPPHTHIYIDAQRIHWYTGHLISVYVYNSLIIIN